MLRMIIVIGNGHNFSIAESLIVSDKVDVVAGIPDYSSPYLANQINFFKIHNIPIIRFENVTDFKVDFCILLAYSKLLYKKELDYFKNTILLHIHGGLLPKWRGTNSNSWAILNGEKIIGQTLHSINEKLDGGDIYYRFIQEFSQDDTLVDVIRNIEKGICRDLPSILLDIHNKKISPQAQCGEFVYCSKLRLSDCHIKDWNMKSRYLYDLHRVIEPPLGPGYLFFMFKGTTYYIQKCALPNKEIHPDYIGIPGAVVHITLNELWVKTKDNIIILKNVLKDKQEVNFLQEFKIGNRLF